MKDTLAKVIAVFKSIDPTVELTVEDLDHGACSVSGPYPSFMLLLDEGQPSRIIIHVNADAPNMIYIMNAFSAEVELVFDGGFAIEKDTGKLLFGEEAYAQKTDNIISIARVALAQKSKDAANETKIYVPGSSKIILG